MACFGWQCYASPVRQLLLAGLLVVSAAGCNCSPDSGDDGGALDAGGPVTIDAGPLDGGDSDAGAPDSGTNDGGPLDAGLADAGGPDAGALDAGPPDAGNPCSPNLCLAGSACTLGDGGLPFACTRCPADAGCPFLRAQAGPDQRTVADAGTTLRGSATGYNGVFGCSWRTTADASVGSTCEVAVSPASDTAYELTVVDATGATASDTMVVRLAALVASAGPDSNITFGATASLTASWEGASCADAGCVGCAWRLFDGGAVSSQCSAQVSPAATTAYFLTVSDAVAGTSATDTATVFVTDRPAQLCAWNVVVLTSNEYPTAANPSFSCDPTGTIRRQTVNSKPAIVLSDLEVGDVRITGYLSVETTSDDDLIGFLWGWQNPKEAYLLSWKRVSQNWTAACGNAPSGFAIKKLDGALAASPGIAFNSSFGFDATSYVYNCADLWSQSRANAPLLKDRTAFLQAPADPGGSTVGWTAFITYRFEFYYTATRTRVLVYADELKNGSTANPVASLLVEDSSYPTGAFAFFSNSQEQVLYGDFTLASLSGFRADAGADLSIGSGQSATLTGSAELAVPPYTCRWSAEDAGVATTCATTVTPMRDTVYRLTITDDMGRTTSDEVLLDVP